MARTTKPLTDKEIKGAKAKKKEYKLFDGGGLYLSVTHKEKKWWRMKYKSPVDGKEKRISVGVYPEVSLANAREQREDIRKKVRNGIDPSQERKDNKEAIKLKETRRGNSFESVAEKWLKTREKESSPRHFVQLTRYLHKYSYPHIGVKPITDVTRMDIIAILEKLKEQDLSETARRTIMVINQVYKYAVTHELAPHVITADIDTKIILGKQVKKHYPTFTKEKDICALLLAIDEFSGHYSTKTAFTILPYLFLRSSNIRQMEWTEINFDTETLTIPPEKMKAKEEFILPLPQQVIKILKNVKENILSERYIFPGLKGNRPISDGTMLTALRRMGYTKEEFNPHSFRAMFSTIAYEYANDPNGHGFTGEVIEACLSHKEKNQVKAAYNRSSYRDAMRGLMQWYADHLDKIKLA